MRLRHPSLPASARAFGWLAAVGMAIGPLVAPGTARANDLASHQAAYTLTLHSARGDVTAATGQMTYEVQNACDGWATQQRLAMTLTNRDGQDVEMLSDYATLESKDGLKMSFHMRQTTDGAVSSDINGEATLQPNGGPGEVHYTGAKPETTPLPKGTLFPTAHTAAIIAAARDGKKFLALPLFDGTSPDGAQYSSIAITSWNPPKADKWPALAKLPSTMVHVAFFDHTKEAVEPDYEVGMRYWDNGVADDLSMDFGDFVMSGKLVTFKLLPAHSC